MRHDVFLSHSFRDKVAAERLCAGLESQGIICWMAHRDIQPGDEWTSSIMSGIKEAKCFVLIMSEEANASTQIRREVQLAVSAGVPLLPIRVDHSVPNAEFEYLVGRLHWLDAQNGIEHAIPQVVSAVRDLLDSSAAINPTASDERERATLFAESLNFPRLSDFSTFSLSSASIDRLDKLSHGLAAETAEIAKLATQLAHLQNPGRSLATVEDALGLISTARSILLLQQDELSKALVEVMGTWSELFRAEQVKLQEQVENARDLENPFTAGNPIIELGSGVFTGRRDITSEIERSILGAAQAPTLLLYGQRRMGKTSILKQLPALLGPKFMRVIIDCQAPGIVESQAALLRYLSRQLANELNQHLNLAKASKEEQQARGAVALPIDVLREDPYATFEDWLDQFEARVPKGIHVLLCLDEFERLEQTLAMPWGGLFLDAMRHWLQHRPLFALMFIGLHTFEQMGPQWTDRFLNSRRVRVSFLAEEDVRQLLTKPSPTFRMTYAPGVLDSIIATTRGQPFLTQALAFELVNHMNQVRRREATIADVEAAVESALESSGDYFADLWGSRSDAEKRILQEVAQGKLHPGAASPVARNLRECDLLDDAGDFTVPLVRRWVAKNKF
jgi:hypothetical protein